MAVASVVSVIGDRQLRVEDRVEGVADERERQDDEDDAHARRGRVPPRAEAGCAGVLGEGQDLAPRRRQRVAQADERQGRLDEHRAGEHEDRVGDDEGHDVGQDVVAHHVPARGADDPRPVDEGALADGQGLAADDPRGRRPRRDADDHDDDQQGDADAGHLGRLAEDLPQDRGQDEGQDEGREDQEEVGDAHQERVGPAADEAGHDPDDGPDEDRDERRQQPDRSSRCGRRGRRG